MIELIPAIDIIEGKCVRLTKGEYDTKKIYGDPVSMAQQFQDMGFERLHVVDLDGAKSRHIVNTETLRSISRTTRLTIDFGGGIKSEDDLKKAFDAGAHLVTVGSLAVTEPDTYLKWQEEYGADHLILGADVRNGRISINGWKEDSEAELNEFLKNYISAGTKNVLCTEISRDGMLQGPATTLYKDIMAAYPECHLIASGGVSSLADIKELEDAGIPAVVFGKSIYEGCIDLKELSDIYFSRKEASC